MGLEGVLRRALKLVKPSPKEEERLREFTRRAVEEVERAASGVEGVLRVSLEGSAAKNTWIKGREEADIFVHFHPSTDKERMEEDIIKIGFEAIKAMGGKPRLMYADHPYVEGVVEGVTVDVVACYDVEPPNWLSATDRTPYHTRYVLGRLREGLEDEVRLLKGFMLGCGVYGAEIKVKGFSGYLAELLTIGYGGFVKVLEDASRWRPPIVLDIEKHYASIEEVVEAFPNQSLIVVDPVDRERNVAAAVSETRLAEFALASRLFLEKPSLKFFRVRRVEASKTRVRRLARGRNLLAIIFGVDGGKPPDVLWGELRRSEEGLKRALQRLGFQVYRSGSWTDEERRCAIVFELSSTRLPEHVLHKGPPTYLPNAVDFLDKWVRKASAGPWVEGFRLYALRRVGEVRAGALIRREVREGRVAVARGLIDRVKKARIYDTLDSILRAVGKDRGMLRFLAEFLEGRPPFLSG